MVEINALIENYKLQDSFSSGYISDEGLKEYMQASMVIMCNLQ